MGLPLTTLLTLPLKATTQLQQHMFSIPLHFLFVCLFFVPDSMDFTIAEMNSTDKN